MLSVKLVRSLLLNQTLLHDHPHNDLNTTDTHNNNNNNNHTNKNNTRKMPMLLFTKTNELISDTFRLSHIASLLGMNFHPSPTLSHLLFSWPPSPSPSPSPSRPRNYNNWNNTLINNTNRISVSSETSTFTATTTTTTMTSSSSSCLPPFTDTVPIPFPTLSTTSSISLLRAFVSLSRGFFKLVFLDYNPNTSPEGNYVNYYHALVNCEPAVELGLYSRVSGRRVKEMGELGRELMGRGWSMYRSKGDLVYLFRKTEGNRVRVRVNGGDGDGEREEGGSRVKELRLSRVEFEKGVNLRVLLYVLLITHDVFYLA